MSQEQEVQEDPKVELQKEGKTIQELIQISSAQITFENMQKLVNTRIYEIEGEKYVRKMLKPKDVIKLQQLQIDLVKFDNDPVKRMDTLKKQAFLCMDGWTDKKWDETDPSKVEIIVGVCLLIVKGFRQI